MAAADYSTQTLNNVTQTLVNVSGGTEIGTSLPPRQNGEFRIPFVTKLRLGPVSSYFGGTQFTLLWDEPDSTESISHYNVYLVGALQNNSTPLGPYSSTSSPAVFRVTPSATGIITFFVQTQLHNGNVSQIDRSPSVTALASPPQIKSGDISPGTIFPSFAGQAVPRSGSYAAVVGDSVVFCNASGGAAIINAPPTPTDGQFFFVKKTDTSANAVTVLDSAGVAVELPNVIPGGTAGALTLCYNEKAALWQVIGKL